MKRWSEQVWNAAESVYQAIIRHPFVCQLASGTLPMENFCFYLAQDTLYIDNYAKVLSHIASRLDNKEHVADFIRFAQDGVYVEKAMHDVFLKGFKVGHVGKSPACLLYTSLLSAQATAPVEVETAAILPCFWIYQKVGRAILQQSADNNPFKLWIDTYSDEAFEASTLRAIEICDELACNAGTETVKKMTEMFVLCTKLEWMFWDSAWTLEKWKI
ncbi:TenA family protein [uncultured Muribaculum sp.]|nr:TenA family protein [uncultured Muribaculum sp.]